LVSTRSPLAARLRGGTRLTLARLVLSEVVVTEAADLALDPRAQRGQQETKLDADIEGVLGHHHPTRGADPLEHEVVSVQL
jgi:hypothetical protein